MIARSQILCRPTWHADETGVNIDGVRHWLHVLSNNLWVYPAFKLQVQ
ncbi:MAG: hypothetical protein R8J85_05315 [Mariprofundales bacterium]